MTGFVLTNEAMSDLKSIGIYTQNTWGRQQRDRYLTALDRGFYVLAADHRSGRDCGDIRDGYRKYKVGKHFIFYREIDETLVEIVRVLHERMDIEAQFPKPNPVTAQ